MLPPHQVPNWISATAHLAHMSANTEKRSPTPQRTPSPPPPPADPDAPLNLTKPKSSSSGSAGSSPHSAAPSAGLQTLNEQPVAATAPKLLPPSLVMPRAFLPYAGLPPQFSPLPPNVDRGKQGKEDKQQQQPPHFPMHMYGLPAPPHMGGRPKDDVKDETDFITACHS